MTKLNFSKKMIVLLFVFFTITQLVGLQNVLIKNDTGLRTISCPTIFQDRTTQSFENIKSTTNENNEKKISLFFFIDPDGPLEGGMDDIKDRLYRIYGLILYSLNGYTKEVEKYFMEAFDLKNIDGDNM